DRTRSNGVGCRHVHGSGEPPGRAIAIGNVVATSTQATIARAAKFGSHALVAGDPTAFKALILSRSFCRFNAPGNNHLDSFWTALLANGGLRRTGSNSPSRCSQCRSDGRASQVAH